MAEQLEYLLTLNDQATGVLKQFGNQAKGLDQKMTSLGGSIAKAGVGMAAIGAAGVAGLVTATNASIEFESTFAGIRKTVNATEEEFAQLEKNIRGISRTTPAATRDLNAIGEIAGQLGVSGVDNLTKFIKTTADIAETTNLTSEEAATSFARIANIMGISVDSVDRMASAVVDLGNNFATTESEIVNFANRIAGAGKIAGIATPELFAIGAAMSSVGVEAEAGGTAVQKVMLSMNEAITQNNSDLAVFAETAGMTVDEFSNAAPIEAFTAFVEGLGAAGDDAIGVLDELGMKDQRLIRAFLSLANAGDLLNETVEKGTSGWEANTALVEEAEKRYGTTASQLEIMRNNLQDINKTIGDSLVPILNDMLETLKPLIEKFAAFAEAHPRVVAGVMIAVAAIGALGAVLIFIGGIIASVGAIIPVLAAVFSALGAAAGAIGGVLAAVAAAIGAISAPVLIIIGIVVALIAALVLLWRNWDTVKAKAIELGGVLRDKLGQAWEWLGGKMAEGKVIGERIKGAFTTAYDSAKQGVTDLFNKIGTFIRGAVALLIKGDFTGEFGRLLGLNEDSPVIAAALAFRDALLGVFEGFMMGVRATLAPFVWIWENLVFPVLFLAFAVISRGVYEIVQFVSTQFEALRAAISTIMAAVKAVFTIVWAEIKQMVFDTMNSILMFLLPILEMINAAFQTAWGAIRDTVVAVWEAMTGYITERVNRWVAIFTILYTLATALFRQLWGQVTAIWSGIAASVTEKVEAVRQNVSTTIENVKARVLAIFNALWQGLRSIGNQIFDAITSPFRRAKEEIEQIAASIKEAARQISPFHKSSPSLVELVESGMDIIRREYRSLNNVDIPSAQTLAGVNSFAPLSNQLAAVPANNTSNVTNINVDAAINTPLDADELALILGNTLANTGIY